MNTAIRGIQDCGKTCLMVGKIRSILIIGSKYLYGYRPDDVVVNFGLNIPGTHSVNNDEMRKYISKVVHKGIRHKIIGITEADRVFPARFWQDKEQTDALLGLWQDVKLFHQIFWDSHIGTSVDLMLRQTAQIELLPQYYKSKDSIEYFIINSLYQKVYFKEMLNVSINCFPYYDRWEVIN